jgi:hypothetical protein
VRRAFKLDFYEKNNQGIYFNLDKEEISKIGKPDGQQELNGRLAVYRKSLVSMFRNGGPTVR